MTKVWAKTNYKVGIQPADDLRSPGLFARWPLIGFAMILIGGLLFGAMAFEVQTHGSLFQQDAPLSRMLYNDALHFPPYITELLIFGFFVGKELTEVIAAILVLYFLHKRFWPELGMLLIGMSGGALLWAFLIGIFNRPRPPAQLGIVVTEPSFPSGHMMQAVLCYGFLAYLLFPKMPARFWKWLLVVATIFTVLFIGASRLILGGHFLTDVLAGTGLGLAWAGLVYTAIEGLFLKKQLSSAK
jgi:undecaprenyl-diphosphatase